MTNLRLTTEEVQRAHALSQNPVTGVALRWFDVWIDWLKENHGPVTLIEHLEADRDRIRAIACDYIRNATPLEVSQ